MGPVEAAVVEKGNTIGAAPGDIRDKFEQNKENVDAKGGERRGSQEFRYRLPSVDEDTANAGDAGGTQSLQS